MSLFHTSTSLCVLSDNLNFDITLQLVERHRAFLSDKDVRGRIYISSQGINCQCGGTSEDASAFAEWAAAQPEFQVGGAQ